MIGRCLPSVFGHLIFKVQQLKERQQVNSSAVNENWLIG